MNHNRIKAGRTLAIVTVTSLAVGGLGGALAACGDDGNAKLTVYSGRAEDFMGPVLDRFEAKTGIETEVRYGDTAELASTILEEGENSPADVFLSQDAGALGALEDENLLGRLDPHVLGLVDRRFRSADGNWVGTTGRARTVAYDSRLLDEADLPASVMDFTDPQWKGRIGWAPTNGSFQAFVTAMRVIKGEEAAREWLEGMAANQTVSYPDNIAVRDAIAAGEIEAGLINHYYVAEAIEAEGDDYPVSLYFPPDGDIGSLINVAGAGILAGTDQVGASKQLVEFVLSPAEQRYFADTIKEYPLIEGVAPDPALVPLAEIEHPDVNLADLADLAATLRLIEDAGAL